MRKKTFNSKLNIENKIISSFQKILLEHKKKRPTLKCYNLKINIKLLKQRMIKTEQ